MVWMMNKARNPNHAIGKSLLNAKEDFEEIGFTASPDRQWNKRRLAGAPARIQSKAGTGLAHRFRIEAPRSCSSWRRTDRWQRRASSQ
jgi:hypothetical protein